MTSSIGGGQGNWPYGSNEDGDATPGTTPESPTSRRDVQADETGGRKLPPVWLLVVIGVVVVGAIVGIVLMLSGGDEEDPQVPPAQTVTLPVPSPTIDAIEREPGTPFFDALPSQVLQFALTETGESPDLAAAGAIEAYRFVYSDGGAATIELLAGQWRDGSGPQARLGAALEQVTAEFGEVPEAGAAPADDADGGDETATDDADGTDGTDDADGTAAATPTAGAPAPEQGPVLVDGQEVGRYVFVPREDGTGTLWWTNTTVLLQLDGPADQLRDVFKAFPL